MLRKSVAVEFGVLVDLAGQKAFAERAEGHEADPEFFERRDDFRFGLSPPQRVFALQRGDRLHRVRAANRLHARFGKAEVLHFALLDQVLHRTRHVLDGHIRVDAVLIEQIDDVGLQPLERSLGDLLDVLRAGCPIRPACRCSGSILNPNLVAITTCSRKGASASPTSSSLVNGP